MPPPDGFDWTERANGEIAISHHGRQVTLLRGRSATRLASKLQTADADRAQHLLARATGNYRRGNERRAR